MEIQHIQRLNEVNPVTVPQIFRRTASDGRVEMDGINGLHIGKFLGDPANGPEHLGHGLPQVFPPVGGDEDQAGIRSPVQLRMGIGGPHRVAHGVDGGIAGDKDGAGVCPLGKQMLLGRLGGGEMVFCHNSDKAAVHFLREWAVEIVGTQPRLHMPHRDLQIEAGQCCGTGCGGIPMNQHHIRLFLLQHTFHVLKHCGGHIEEGLFFPHDVQIIVRSHLEGLHHPIQHLPVLPGDTDYRFQSRTFFQFFHQGAHFDRLGSGTKYKHNLFHV